MAEVTRRSFDLKSWQGLTLVLKVARESHLSPSAYAEFRNLVLEYAQQKGTDQKLKARIDAIIATFDDPERKEIATPVVRNSEPERLGRRIIPQFVPKAPTPKEVDVQTEAPVQAAPAQPSIPPPPPREVPVTPSEAPPVVVPPVEVTPPAPAVPVPPSSHETSTLKSVDEHRARIMEIKRRVNSAVKNPITLVDHGDQIGREYMAALLGALKATSPGSTHNLEEAMAVLEAAFSRVVERLARPLDDAEEASAPSQTPPPSPAPEPTPRVEVPQDVVVPAPEPVPPPTPIGSAPEPEPIAEPAPLPEPVVTPEEEREEKMSESVTEAVPSETEKPKRDTSPEEARWSEEGGDADVQEQIRTLREQLKHVGPSPKAVRTGRRSLIPSLLEIEEDAPPRADVTGTDWDPYGKRRDADELSPRALTERPTSTMTGITLGTPQSELMTPEVTMALTKLLHEWKIFASSGLFGMGPGGIEHPLYVKLARLPMGEVVSGRYEDAEPKIVHAIKDYVDAWRHEQGVAYNPAETFEHYLRRVSQRILKRQSGIIEN